MFGRGALWLARHTVPIGSVLRSAHETQNVESLQRVRLEVYFFERQKQETEEEEENNEKDMLREVSKTRYRIRY